MAGAATGKTSTRATRLEGMSASCKLGSKMPRLEGCWASWLLHYWGILGFLFFALRSKFWSSLTTPGPHGSAEGAPITMSKRPTDHLLPPTKKRGADRQITQDDPDSDEVSLCIGMAEAEGTKPPSIPWTCPVLLKASALEAACFASRRALLQT